MLQINAVKLPSRKSIKFGIDTQSSVEMDKLLKGKCPKKVPINISTDVR